MDTVVHSLTNLQLRGQIRGDDTVDQFHHFVTVYLLAFGGFLIGLKEFVGEPLDCWVNLSNWQHFQGHVNSYCWAHKLYKFPNASDYSQFPYQLQPGLAGPGKEFTSNGELEDLGEINFYRWVTVIFFVQAFLFKLPSLIWSELNAHSGTQIEKLVSMMTDTTFEDEHKKDVVFSTVARFIETWLKINRKPFVFMKTKIGQTAKKVLRHCMVCIGGNSGNYLSTVYLLVKFLFLLNVLLQFWILSEFLDFNYWTYGSDAAETIQSGDVNERFPRVALCHFQLQEEGYWIQCILSINMLLEIIFLVEWFWLLFLLIITLYSFCNWALKILQTNMSVRFITRYLIQSSSDRTLSKDETKSINNFVVLYLGNDGVFLLRILATNTNDVAMADLVCKVWKRYLEYGDTSGGEASNKLRTDNFKDEAKQRIEDGTILNIDKKRID